MPDTEDNSSSSSTSVPITENISSPAISAPDDEAKRSFCATQQLRKSILTQKSPLPCDSSQSSYPFPVSSLGGSLQQYIPSLIQPVLASHLIAETRGIREMIARTAVAQIQTIAQPSFLFFQRERHVLQNLFSSARMVEHLFPPMIFSSGVLTKSFFSSHRLLFQHISDLSNQLNASLVALTHRLTEPLRRAEEWLKLRLLAAFQRAKLCLAPSLPTKLIYQIMSHVEAGDLRPVTILLWSYYARNRHSRLREAVNSWFDHPEFAARRHIFEEAFASHCEERYVASIRILTPEIEGFGSYTVREHNLRAIHKNGKDSGLRLGKTTSVVTT